MTRTASMSYFLTDDTLNIWQTHQQVYMLERQLMGYLLMSYIVLPHLQGYLDSNIYYFIIFKLGLY